MAQLNYKSLGFPDPSQMNQGQLNSYLSTPARPTYARGGLMGAKLADPNMPFMHGIYNAQAQSKALNGIAGSGANHFTRPANKGYRALQHMLLQQFYPDYLRQKPALQGTNLQSIMGSNKSLMPDHLNSYSITPDQLSAVPMSKLQEMIHKAAMINYKEKNDGGGPLGGMISPASVLGAGLGFVGAPLALKAAAGAVGNLAGAGGSAPGGSAPGGAGFQASAQRSPIPQNRGATPFNRGLPNLGASPNTGILGRRR